MSKDEAILEKAYFHALPPVIFEAYARVAANKETPKGLLGVNRLGHRRRLVTPEDDEGSARNQDTVYSAGFLDLSQGPVVIHKPYSTRFFNFLLLDAYGDFIDILGTGGVGGDDEKDYLITTKSVSSSEYEVIVSPTTLLHVLVRIIVFHGTDSEYEEIRSLQDGITIDRLDGTTATDTEKYRVERDDELLKLGARKYVYSLSTEEVFNRFNKFVEKNPPKGEFGEQLKELERYGIGAQKTFSYQNLNEETISKVKRLPEKFAAFESRPWEGARDINGWKVGPEMASLIGEDIIERVWMLMWGPGTNPARIAVYATAYKDSDGQELDGRENYVLHFQKGELPPHKKGGFWSLITYTLPDMFLFDGKGKAIILNDRSDYNVNADGSVDIYVGHKSPGAEEESNWIYVGEEAFQITARIYLPTEQVVNGNYKLPAVRRL